MTNKTKKNVVSKKLNKIVINGFELEVKSVSPLAPKSIETQYKKNNPEPKQPTYTVEAVGGVSEEFKHTLDTVETPEEIAQLKDWQDAHDAWTSGLTFKLLRLFMSQGITLKATNKQLADIESQLIVLELDVPKSRIERDLFYLETFVINNEKSMQKVIEAVLGETGIDAEALAEANATFRN